MRALLIVLAIFLGLGGDNARAQVMVNNGRIGGLGVAGVASAAVPYINVGDKTNYTQGVYNNYNSSFGTYSGKVISMTSTLNVDLFRDHGAVRMDWVAGTGCTTLGQPCGYAPLQWGCYHWTIPAIQQTPRRVANITQLKFTWDTTSSSPTNFGDLLEWYLYLNNTCDADDDDVTTSDGDPINRLVEIGIMKGGNAQAKAYASSGTLLTTVIDPSGVTYKFYQTPTAAFVLGLAFDTETGDPIDVPTGSLDAKAVMDALVSVGRINNQWYFKGVAIGAEAHTTTGFYEVRSFTVNYAGTP